MIENLEKKLSGELPVTRIELIDLIDSWGRNYNNANNINLEYDLSKLDVSKIDDMNHLFASSNFNGDISNWDTSKVTNMSSMFFHSKFNNNSISNWNVSNVRYMSNMFESSLFNCDLNNWDVSNVASMKFMFCYSQFNQDISKWQTNTLINLTKMFAYSKFDKDISNFDFTNVKNCYLLFYSNENFENKYNNGNELPEKTNLIIEWIQNNKNLIKKLNITKEDILEMDDYLNSFNKLSNEFNLN